jgi:hypothetical protein
MRYLFVGGPARSGTSAFAHLLNHHPRIALGMERYKYLYNLRTKKHASFWWPNWVQWLTGHDPIAKDIGPHLFESERFFRFDNAETNIGAARLGNPKFKRKFERATYRGDKVPSMMRFYQSLNKGLPESRFIIVYRDVYRVCSSWNKRAQDPEDHWPATKNFKVAVDAINLELSRAANFQSEHPGRCLIIRNENIFGPDGLDTLAALLDWLELRRHPSITLALKKKMEIAERLKDKPLLEYDGQRDYIQQNIDWSVIGRIEAVAL